MASPSRSRHETEVDVMTTADVMRDLAVALVRTEPDTERAVNELETVCGGRRVAAVRARQLLLSSVEEDAVDEDVARAVALLDDLLERLPA
jgi:hypothetical protein